MSLCPKAGIEDLRFHDFRHEATSMLFEKGLNPVEVCNNHRPKRHQGADVLYAFKGGAFGGEAEMIR